MERFSDPNSGTFQSGARKEGRLPAGLISDAGLYRKASEQDPDRDPQVSVQREGRHQRQHSVDAECPKETRGHGQFILPWRVVPGPWAANRASTCVPTSSADVRAQIPRIPHIPDTIEIRVQGQAHRCERHSPDALCPEEDVSRMPEISRFFGIIVQMYCKRQTNPSVPAIKLMRK